MQQLELPAQQSAYPPGVRYDIRFTRDNVFQKQGGRVAPPRPLISSTPADAQPKHFTRQQSRLAAQQKAPADRLTANVQRSATTAGTSSILKRVTGFISDRTGSPRSQMHAKVSAIIMKPEPTTLAEAYAGDEKDLWMIAVQEELNAHAKNGTWVTVPRPDGATEISAKWVFKRKLNPNNSIDRYKARLVARGFSQVAGIDYNEVFSPVVRFDSIRLLFAVSLQKNLICYQFDIATAFLNGVLEEELYLQPPEGVTVPPGHTLKLIRSLYGLKQSPRCWNKCLTGILNEYNMYATYSDPCVFVSKGNEPLILALYVDDGLVFGHTASLINNLMAFLRQRLEINEVKSSCFVGMEVQRSSKF